MTWAENDRAVEKVMDELLSRDREPSPLLVLLKMEDTSGMTAEQIKAKRVQVVAELKAFRNTALDWFDANVGLIKYQAACRAIYGCDKVVKL